MLNHFPQLSPLAEARDAALEHRFEVAAKLAQHVMSAAPTCLAALRVLAWSQLELGEDRAVHTFERCAALDPEDARAEVGQAIWYQQRDNGEQAIPHWVRAWELDSDNQNIRRALVRLTGELPESALADGIGLLRLGRFEEAAEVLNPLAQAAQPAAMLGVIAALRALGARRQADSLALALHAAAPSCVQGLLYVAAFEEAAGRSLRGRDLLARAEQADPGLHFFGELARELHLTPAAAVASAGASDALRTSRPLVQAWS